MARLHKYDDFGHIRMANLCLFAILPLLENTLYGENVSHKGITRTDRRTDRQTLAFLSEPKMNTFEFE